MTINHPTTTGFNTLKRSLGYKSLALFMMMSLSGDQQQVNAQTSHNDFLSLEESHSLVIDTNNSIYQDIDQGFDQYQLDQLTKILQDPYHPLVSNLFARPKDRKSLIDGLIGNYGKVCHLIEQHGNNNLWLHGDSKTFLGAWAILESCLRADIVANPKSKNYNAAGLYQYIPDTWRTRYTRFKQKYPEIKITNDRKDPLSNLLVTQYNLDITQKSFDNKPDFALWAHHAGEARVKRYYNEYKALTGSEPLSMMDWYNQILPRELVDQFMSLRDNSFIYVSQIIGAQSVYQLLLEDPNKVQNIIDDYLHNQITHTKGAGIDDLHYKIRIDNVTQSPLKQDTTLTLLLDYLANVCELDLDQANLSDRDEWHQYNLATSALLVGRGTKIIIPYSSFESLRTSKTLNALKYKRIRYVLELARIHGLCSIANERLPNGQLVINIGLMSHITGEDIGRFMTLQNRNKKPPHKEEINNDVIQASTEQK